MQHIVQPSLSTLVGTFANERTGRHGLVGFRALGGGAARPFTAPTASTATAADTAMAARQQHCDPSSMRSSSNRRRCHGDGSGGSGGGNASVPRTQRARCFQKGTPYQATRPTVGGQRFVFQAPPISAAYNTAGTIKGLLQDAAVTRLDAEQVRRARSRGRGFASQYPSRKPKSIFASSNIGDCTSGRQDLGGARERVFNKDYKDHTSLWSARKGAMVADKSVAQTSSMAVGDVVECRKFRKMHVCTIVRARLNGTYDAEFEEDHPDERLAGQTFRNMSRANFRTKEAGSGEIKFCHRWGGQEPKRRYHHTDVSWDVTKFKPSAYHPQKPQLRSGPEPFDRSQRRNHRSR